MEAAAKEVESSSEGSGDRSSRVCGQSDQERDDLERVENGASPQQRLKQPKSNATPSEPTTEWTNTLAQQTFFKIIPDKPMSPTPLRFCHRDQEQDDQELDARERQKMRQVHSSTWRQPKTDTTRSSNH